ncbi:MAG: hypothetical protein O7G85_05620 [Planctomycetota bacterium]|nr:hypothetical protein [Planctomycetota bacterium]
MPRKSKTPFKVKQSQAIHLAEIQTTALARSRSAKSKQALDQGKTIPRNWKKPRRVTRSTTLKELAIWLDLPDGRAVREAADSREIRLREVSPRRFFGCMMDVARLNPRCLKDSAPE